VTGIARWLVDAVATNPLELAGVLFGIVSVWLSVRQHIWSWPTAIVNVGIYVVVFWRARLYADMGLQVIYIILSVYGWYEWLYGGENRTRLTVSRATARQAGVLALIGVAGMTTLGAGLSRWTDAALPWWDAGTTTASLIAQFLMTRKVLENWALWIAVDVVYIGMYIFKGLYLTTVLYAVFLGLSATGLAQWRRSLRAAGVPG
jgi:nicotinamide mononucleotide transporter